MKFIDEFRDQALVQDLARRLEALAALTEAPPPSWRSAAPTPWPRPASA